MNPTVSVVIPSFNRGDLIVFTLDSVARQSFQDWECLIVDDASTDQTPEVIAQWESKDPRFKGLQNKRQKGAQGARNTGLMMARGQFVLFVDSDDLLHERKIELHMKCFKDYPNLDMNYACDVFFNQVPRDSDVLWNIPSKEDIISRFLHDDVPFCVQSPIWKVSSIRKYGMHWDENLSCWQDWDFNLRSIARGMQYANLPKVLGYIRNHESGRISNVTSKKTFKSMLRSIKSVRRELLKKDALRTDYRNACNVFLLQVLASVFRQKKRNTEMIYAYYDLLFFMMRLNGKLSIRLMLKSLYYLLFDFQNMHGWTLTYVKQKYAIVRAVESTWSKVSLHESHTVKYP